MPTAVRDWFPCDLARDDEFGKTLYIGVLTDELLVKPQEEGNIRLSPITFVFRLNIDPQDPRSDPRPVALSIADARGEAIAQVEGRVSADLLRGTRLNLNFALSALQLPGSGDYRVRLSFGDYSFEDQLRVRVRPQVGEEPIGGTAQSGTI